MVKEIKKIEIISILKTKMAFCGGSFEPKHLAFMEISNGIILAYKQTPLATLYTNKDNTLAYDIAIILLQQIEKAEK